MPRRLLILILFLVPAPDAAADADGQFPVRRLAALPAEEKVGPRLADLLTKAPGDRIITVLADLSVQVDLAALGARMTDERLSRSRRAARVREALQEVAGRQQAALTETLEAWRAQGRVRSWRGVRIVNRLILELRAEAVGELAALPALARLWDGERIRELDRPLRPVSLSAGARWPRDLRRANWALEAMGVPALWKRRHNGRRTVATVVDGLERASVEMSGIDVIEPDLETVFLHLTGRALRD